MNQQQKVGLGVLVFLGGCAALLARAPEPALVPDQEVDHPPGPPPPAPRQSSVSATPTVEVITPDGERFAV